MRICTNLYSKVELPILLLKGATLGLCFLVGIGIYLEAPNVVHRGLEDLTFVVAKVSNEFKVPAEAVLVIFYYNFFFFLIQLLATYETYKLARDDGS